MFKAWFNQHAARMVNRTRRFLKETQGVTASEYAFMLALMIIFLIGAITVLSESTKGIHEEISNTLNTSITTNL